MRPWIGGVIGSKNKLWLPRTHQASKLWMTSIHWTPRNGHQDPNYIYKLWVPFESSEHQALSLVEPWTSIIRTASKYKFICSVLSIQWSADYWASEHQRLETIRHPIMVPSILIPHVILMGFSERLLLDQAIMELNSLDIFHSWF